MSNWTTSGRSRLKARQNRSFAQRAQQRARVVAPEAMMISGHSSRSPWQSNRQTTRRHQSASKTRYSNGNPIARRGIVVQIGGDSPPGGNNGVDQDQGNVYRSRRIRDPSARYGITRPRMPTRTQPPERPLPNYQQYGQAATIPGANRSPVIQSQQYPYPVIPPPQAGIQQLAGPPSLNDDATTIATLDDDMPRYNIPASSSGAYYTDMVGPSFPPTHQLIQSSLASPGYSRQGRRYAVQARPPGLGFSRFQTRATTEVGNYASPFSLEDGVQPFQLEVQQQPTSRGGISRFQKRAASPMMQMDDTNGQELREISNLVPLNNESYGACEQDIQHGDQMPPRTKRSMPLYNYQALRDVHTRVESDSFDIPREDASFCNLTAAGGSGLTFSPPTKSPFGETPREVHIPSLRFFDNGQEIDSAGNPLMSPGAPPQHESSPTRTVNRNRLAH